MNLKVVVQTESGEVVQEYSQFVLFGINTDVDPIMISSIAKVLLTDEEAAAVIRKMFGFIVDRLSTLC